MKQRRDFIYLLTILILSTFSFLVGKQFTQSTNSDETENKGTIAIIEKRMSMKNDHRWKRCIYASDGKSYMKDSTKSTDGGKTFIQYSDVNIDDIINQPERAVLSNPEIFYALNSSTQIKSPGIFSKKHKPC